MQIVLQLISTKELTSIQYHVRYNSTELIAQGSI